jgi:hypothetical protein
LGELLYQFDIGIVDLFEKIENGKGCNEIYHTAKDDAKYFKLNKIIYC